MTWIRVNEQVDADVRFLSVSSVPRLQAIEWNGALYRFVGTARVRRDATGMIFTVRDEAARYTVQLDQAEQQWRLIAIDDPANQTGSSAPTRGTPNERAAFART